MAKIQFLTILLAVTCFLGGVVSVTDKEFDVSDVFYSTSVSIIAILTCDLLFRRCRVTRIGICHQ